MFSTIPAFAVPGGPELLIILAILILLFGASRIPKMARAAGESIGEFKKGQEAAERDLEEIRNASSSEEIAEIEEQTS